MSIGHAQSLWGPKQEPGPVFQLPGSHVRLGGGVALVTQ